MITNGPLVHFAGNYLRFRSADPRLLQTLQTHFRHCTGGEGRHLADYSITPDGQDVFSVVRDTEAPLSGLTFERVLSHLMQDGLTQLNGASTSHLVFHAGAISKGEQGVLILGKSGSGKSTLAASLLISGWDYLTDEVIAFPLEGERLSGFGRSLVIKKGSQFIWERWQGDAAPDGLLRFADGTAWIAPTLLNPAPPRPEVLPHLSLFARYEAGAALKAVRLTAASTLFQLLQLLVNARNFPDRGLEAASRLSRLVPAYSLTYSSVEEAASWIQQQLHKR